MCTDKRSKVVLKDIIINKVSDVDICLKIDEMALKRT